MKGLGIEKNLGQGIAPKIGNGLKKMAMQYGTGKKKRTDRSCKPNSTQSQVYYTMQKPRRNGRYLPTKGTNNGQDGNEEMKVGMIKGNFKIPSMTLRMRRTRKVIQKIPVS